MSGNAPRETGIALPAIPNFPVLVPEAVDYRASQHPSRVIITYPEPGTSKFIGVTWAQFAHSVDRAAWAFDAQLGARKTSLDPVKVVGVLARSDPAYMVTVYALHKCGITPLLISTRNSQAAIVNLLTLTNSVAILVDSYHKEAAEQAVTTLGGLPVFGLAPLPGPITDKRNPFPFMLKYEDECDNPGVILHTSGSTGLPKPVAWSTRFFWHQTYYPESYRAKYMDSVFLSTLPIFHGSGFSLTRASILWLGWKLVFPDPSQPVTAYTIAELCNKISPDIVAGAPSVIEEIPSLRGGVDVMKGRRTWFFVGAPVSPHFGDLLIKLGVHITPNLGSTEIGQVSVLEPEDRTQEDWNYHEIRPDLDIILQSHGPSPDEGPFELIILAKDGWKPGVVNINIDGVDGYATSDLYQKHPSNVRLLKHCGRVDDIVVLSNGEKTLSRAIEVVLEADAHISDAIVFGSGRSQNGVLIVPAKGFSFDPKDTQKVAKFRDLIWPSVVQANSANPGHSQIWKEMLLVVDSDKELPRTDKGSVKRKLAIDLYAREIDELYAALEGAVASTTLPPLPLNLTVDQLVSYFEALVYEAMGKVVHPWDDVFSLGMDSLQAIFLRNALLSTLQRDERTKELISSLPQNFVFTNTTAEKMADALFLLLGTGTLVGGHEQEPKDQHAQMINDTVAKYTQDFVKHEGRGEATSIGEVVLLTGSTGSLGTYLLRSLLAQPIVRKVYALNRIGSLSVERQKASYSERRLSVEELDKAVSSGRLEFHEVALHEPNFGIPEEIYQSMLSVATMVIHNAWALNFNWSLATFEAVHIRGIRSLVDFALSSPRAVPPRIAFTSSISTVGACTGLVPEIPWDDPAMCMPHGYACAKFVSERILAVASERCSLRTTCFRIGQIAGDTVNGIWNPTDSVPVLLKGCQELGAIPTDWLPVISWTPVDVVAQTIVDVCMDANGYGVFHIAHPSPTPWPLVAPYLAHSLTTKAHPVIESMTMREWVQCLKESGHSPVVNPAMKLISFFEGLSKGNGVRCRLDLAKAKSVSATLKDANPIDSSTLDLYLDYWKRIKFLQ